MKPGVGVTQKSFQSLRAVEKMLSNKCLFVSIIITSALLFVTVLVFNALDGNPGLSNFHPFEHSVGNISAMFPLRITPAGWAFSIWGMIYLLLLGLTMYSLSLLCRTTVSGQPAYCSPAVLSPIFFVLFSLSSCLNVGWLFLWDRIMIFASLVFLMVSVLTLFSALSIASTRLAFYKTELIDSGRKLDVKIIEVVVINGIAMYATWSTVATLINFGVLAVYKSQMHWSDEMASIVCLGILLGFVILYTAFDLSIFDKYSRYTLTPYMVVIWALSAIIDKNWDVQVWSSIMAAVMLGVTCMLFLAKLILCLYRRSQANNPYRRLKVKVDGGINLIEK